MVCEGVWRDGAFHLWRRHHHPVRCQPDSDWAFFRWS